jgi:hypothetical protein
LVISADSAQQISYEGGVAASPGLTPCLETLTGVAFHYNPVIPTRITTLGKNGIFLAFESEELYPNKGTKLIHINPNLYFKSC